MQVSLTIIDTTWMFPHVDSAFLTISFPAETINCKNENKAVETWRSEFVNFEQQHWGQLPWDVFRQGELSSEYSNYNENFMFSYAGAVFMSINMRTDADDAFAADGIESVETVQQKVAANLEWINIAYNEFRQEKEVKTIFLFTHDASSDANTLFFVEFSYLLEDVYKDMDFILVYHSENGSVGIDEKSLGLKNLSLLGVEGTVWPPLRMTLEFEGGRVNMELDQNWETEEEVPEN